MVMNNYQSKEYLEKIKSYLVDMINDLKKSDKWKTHLTMKMNFSSSEDSYEKPLIHSKGNTKEIISGF